MTASYFTEAYRDHPVELGGLFDVGYSLRRETGEQPAPGRHLKFIAQFIPQELPHDRPLHSRSDAFRTWLVVTRAEDLNLWVFRRPPKPESEVRFPVVGSLHFLPSGRDRDLSDRFLLGE